MPRKARIDAPGALHHIIIRGIEQRQIFRDDRDRDQFIQRLSNILTDAGTPCYAWALIPNHVHLFLKTGLTSIATIMRRLLTGYAVYFNRRHRRCGHLFQNRYKSILCQEEAYLRGLVRYIHLNPLRAKLIKDLKALEKYPYNRHSAVLGRVKRDWQQVDYVLGFFGKRKSDAKKEQLESRYRLKAEGFDVEQVAERVAQVLDVSVEFVWEKSRRPQVVDARSLLCYWASKELGMSMTDLAKRLNLTQPAISIAVRRGEKFASSNQYKLIGG